MRSTGELCHWPKAALKWTVFQRLPRAESAREEGRDPDKTEAAEEAVQAGQGRRPSHNQQPSPAQRAWQGRQPSWVGGRAVYAALSLPGAKHIFQMRKLKRGKGPLTRVTFLLQNQEWNLHRWRCPTTVQSRPSGSSSSGPNVLGASVPGSRPVTIWSHGMSPTSPVKGQVLRLTAHSPCSSSDGNSVAERIIFKEAKLEMTEINDEKSSNVTE